MGRDIVSLITFTAVAAIAVALDRGKRHSRAVVVGLLALAFVVGVFVAYGDRVTKVGLLGANLELAKAEINGAKDNAIEEIRRKAVEQRAFLAWEDVTAQTDKFSPGRYDYFYQVSKDGKVIGAFRPSVVNEDDMGGDYSGGKTFSVNYANRSVPLLTVSLTQTTRRVSSGDLFFVGKTRRQHRGANDRGQLALAAHGAMRRRRTAESLDRQTEM